MDRRALIQRRQEVQDKIASKKGNRSRDIFSVGDKVRVKSHINGRWSTKGTVTEARYSGTSSLPASFLILTDSGTEILRHKSYMKHNTSDFDLGNEPDSENSSAPDKPVVETAETEDPALPIEPDSTGNPWEGRLRARKPKE